jgi:hypothetical protein
MSEKSAEDLAFDALLENLMSCPDADLLTEVAEDPGADVKEIAARTLSVLTDAVTDFQHQYVEALRARRHSELQRLCDERTQIPESADARRKMLARLIDQEGENVTLQHRNLTEMTDDDVESALAQLMHLVEKATSEDGGGSET